MDADADSMLEVLELHAATLATRDGGQDSPKSWPVTWERIDVIDMDVRDDGSQNAAHSDGMKQTNLLSKGGRLHPEGVAHNTELEAGGELMHCGCHAQTSTACVGATKPALLRLPGSPLRRLDVEGLKQKAIEHRLESVRMAGVRVPMTGAPKQPDTACPFRYYDAKRPMTEWLARDGVVGATPHTPRHVFE